MVEPLGLPESLPPKSSVDLRCSMTNPTLESLKFMFQRQFRVQFEEQVDVTWHNNRAMHLPDGTAASVLDGFEHHLCKLSLLQEADRSHPVKPPFHFGKDPSTQFQRCV